MSDIELVIKMPEKVYRSIKEIPASSMFSIDCDSRIREAITNGKSLPKGHGRLIDADSMKTMKNIQSANFNAVELIRLWIDNQPTIIEAESEVVE